MPVIERFFGSNRISHAHGLRRPRVTKRSGSISAHGEPPPGTAGWAARIGIGKARERLGQRATELDDPNLTPARRTEPQAANEIDRQHLDEPATDVESMMRDPANAGIAARDTDFVAPE